MIKKIISTGTLIADDGDGAVTIPFSGTAVNMWFWIPDTSSIKTTWRDPANALNQGNIGNVGDLFLASTAKTVNTVDGQFYITELLNFARTLIVE